MIAGWPELTGAAAVQAALWIFVRGSALVAVAWLIARFAPRRGAPVEHVVWSLLLAALLVLPGVSSMLPGPRGGAAIVPAEVWEARLAPLDGPVAPVLPDARGVRSPTAPRPAEIGPAGSPDTTAPPRWPGALLALWGLGAAGLLCRVGARQVSLRVLESRCPTNARASEVAARLARQLGIRRRVDVVDCPSLPVPACWGVLRPKIALPADAGTWGTPRLRTVLLHELAHVRRWDYAAYLAGEVACAFYWPNPLVRWAAAQARIASEMACDELVLRSGAPPGAYASLLASTARDAWRGAPASRPVMPMAGTSELRRRIGSIQGFRGPRPASRRAIVATAAGALAIVLAIAAFDLGSDREARRASARTAVHAASPEARVGAARALGRLRAAADVPTLVALLEDRAPAVRVAAAAALGSTGSRLATRPLMRRLDDRDPAARTAAILALGRLRDRRAFYDLEELTGATDADVRIAAIWAIGEIKCEPAIRRLAGLVLRSADAEARLVAARGLRGAPSHLAGPALSAALADPDPRVRAAAAESIDLTS